MAGRSIPSNMYKQLIQLFLQSVGIKEATRRLKISRNTVRRYYRQLEECPDGLTRLLEKEEPELHVWFNPPCIVDVDRERYQDLAARASHLLAELGRPGVTKLLLWHEYIAENPQGYAYSQFCHWLAIFGAPRRVSMVQDVPPGEALFIDFAGRTMEVIDPESGQIHRRQLFVATMGYSYLTYAEAIPSQRIEDFIAVLNRAMIFFGGAPKTIVCDNFKAAVVRADRYEPTIQQSLIDLASHYGTTITAARVARPQDKARVELSVRYVYLRVLGPLRDRQFFSDYELNRAIATQMQAANERVMKRYETSRRQRFDDDEAPALATLPAQPFELIYRRRLKAQRNNHIYLAQDRTYYSVPYTCIGSTVEVIYTTTLIKVYHQGSCVAVHRRTYAKYAHVTSKEHMPAAHQAMLSRDTQRYISWAESTKSQAIAAVVLRLLSSRQFPQQAYRGCDGIRALHRRYGTAIVEEACQTALDLDQCHYGFLWKYLRAHAPKGTPQATTDSASNRTLPEHENIRGAAYYT